MMRTGNASCWERLTEAEFENKERKRWTRHGSTRYIWDPDFLRNSLRYVLEQQGERMQWYCDDEYKAMISEPRATQSEPRAQASG